MASKADSKNPKSPGTQPATQSTAQADAGARQSQPPAKPTMGEGSYEATRDYQKSVGDYLRHADVKADAEAARPRSEEEAQSLERAEREGRAHAKTGRGDERMDDKKQVPRS